MRFTNLWGYAFPFLHQRITVTLESDTHEKLQTYPLKIIQRFSDDLNLFASFVIDNFLGKNDTFVNSLSFFNPRKAGWLLAGKHIIKRRKLYGTKAFRGQEGGIDGFFVL
jgi:hypothetical protein